MRLDVTHAAGTSVEAFRVMEVQRAESRECKVKREARMRGRVKAEGGGDMKYSKYDM